jgi:peptidoglycan/xylan/chitin deacetylase (PgdA/CDA1 family)
MRRLPLGAFALASVFGVACGDAGPRGGDGIAHDSAPLSVPSGDPYLDFDENASNSSHIALTFDDGPDTSGNTAKVLDTLKAKGVKATFFINTDNYSYVAGSSTAQHLIQRMVDEGHQVGNHTVHHYDLNDTDVNVESELMGVQKFLSSNVPEALSTRLFRAPFGNPYFGPQSRLDYVSPIAARHGVHIGWNIDSEDAGSCSSSSSPQTCTKNHVLDGVDAGKSGIVLMHCTQPHTAAVLGSLIDALRSRGKTFVQVEEMVVEKYGKPSRHLVHCRYDSDCSPGDECSSSTNRCVAEGDTSPPPPPPPPASGTWSSAPSSPLAGRRDAALVWTGGQAFVWGGRGDDDAYLSDGALLDASTRSWTSIPRAPLSGRSETAATWANGRVFVFGGRNDTYSRMRSAMTFDPATMQWDRIASAPDTLSCRPQAVYAPSTNEAIVYGCVWDSSAGHYYPRGFAYGFDTGAWRTIADSPLTAREGFGIAWAANRMIVWGGANERSRGPNGTAKSTGAMYDPSTDSWVMMPDSPLTARYAVTTTTSGNRVFFVAGFASGATDAYGDGAIFDAGSSTWTMLPAMPTPHMLSALATDGTRLFTWGGTLPNDLRTSRGYVLDLGDGSWSELPSSPLSARTQPLGAWDGSSFWVVGGQRETIGYGDAASFMP